jgi:hypothetical protein
MYTALKKIDQRFPIKSKIDSSDMTGVADKSSLMGTLVERNIIIESDRIRPEILS